MTLATATNWYDTTGTTGELLCNTYTSCETVDIYINYRKKLVLIFLLIFQRYLKKIKNLLLKRIRREQ